MSIWSTISLISREEVNLLKFISQILFKLFKQLSAFLLYQGINDKICSLNYKNYKAEIKTADAQDSYKDGVIVLVTGCLTGKDSLRRKFTQTFFLAPQDKGYYVLNDIFRYVDENGSDMVPVVDNGVQETPSNSLEPNAGWLYNCFFCFS